MGNAGDAKGTYIPVNCTEQSQGAASEGRPSQAPTLELNKVRGPQGPEPPPLPIQNGVSRGGTAGVLKVKNPTAAKANRSDMN